MKSVHAQSVTVLTVNENGIHTQRTKHYATQRAATIAARTLSRVLPFEDYGVSMTLYAHDDADYSAVTRKELQYVNGNLASVAVSHVTTHATHAY